MTSDKLNKKRRRVKIAVRAATAMAGESDKLRFSRVWEKWSTPNFRVLRHGCVDSGFGSRRELFGFIEESWKHN